MAIRQPGPPPRAKAPTRPRWQSKYHGVRMTPEQYLSLPEEKPYLEYFDGMVVQKPMVSEEHANVVGEIIYRLKSFLNDPKARVGPEARAKLGDLPNFRLPDVSYYRPELPKKQQAPPSLAVEVRSESQTLAELQRKCEMLRASGVETCWLIDPFARTAFLYEARKKGAPTEVLRADCLPGFELALSELFAVLDD